MDEVGTVVLEVKDIDWEGGTIPTFDDVKVEDLTSVNYICDHDDGSNCSENIVEGKNLNVIENVILGTSQDNVKEVIFSPTVKETLKPDIPLDLKDMLQLDSASEKEILMNDSYELKQPGKFGSKGKKKYSVPRKFTCDICNMKFVSYCSLQIHIRRHMGYNPFLCEVCGQAYPTKTQVLRHMKNHTNKLEHFCGECGKSSLDISTLKKHAKFKHGADKDTYNLYRIKEEVSHQGEKVIFIKTFRNGETNIRRFKLIEAVDNKTSHEI